MYTQTSSLLLSIILFRNVYLSRPQRPVIELFFVESISASNELLGNVYEMVALGVIAVRRLVSRVNVNERNENLNVVTW